MQYFQFKSLRKSSGGAILEYLLIVGVVCFTCIIAMRDYGAKIEDSYIKISRELGPAQGYYTLPPAQSSGGKRAAATGYF